MNNHHSVLSKFAIHLNRSTMECQDDTVPHQIFCILLYQGSSKDVVINYTLLLLNLLVASSPLFAIPNGTTWSISNRNDFHRKRIYAFLCFTFVSTFQIVLCLLVKCSGISIIWCALAGWILMDYYHPGPGDQVSVSNTDDHAFVCRIDYHQRIILIIDLVAVVYYAIVMEPITTVAHVLGFVILGMPLHVITTRLSLVNNTIGENAYQRIS